MMKKSKKSGGKLTIANASENIVKLLEVTKLKSFFQLSSSVDEAMRNLEE